MIYNQVLLLPFYVASSISTFTLSSSPSDRIASLSILIPCWLGVLFFGITLHYGNANVMVLSGDNEGMRDVKIEVLELESQKIITKSF